MQEISAHLVMLGPTIQQREVLGGAKKPCEELTSWRLMLSWG